MKLATKLKYLTTFEVLLMVLVLLLIYMLPQAQVAAYRLWEIFPALMAAIITTLGLKGMKEKT